MQIITSGNTLTMSSREIAELTGKQHRNVVRDIRTMLDELERDALTFEHIYLDGMNRQQTEYLLDRELTETLITGYSIKLRHKVILRLHELEQMASAHAIPQTLPEALRLAADLAEQNVVLLASNKKQAEKIGAMENLFHEGMTIPQFCKGLNGVNVMQVCSFLESRNWLFNESKHSTRWRAASYARDRYLTEHQTTITPHGAEPFTAFTPVLLKKGAARLYDLYLNNELPMKKTWDGLFTHDKALQGAA
ncbi:Rha family transcriptional regulator [Stutzerimonas stutzeri]|uniref:Rha family transcriptional regulator n=1 Tax=Stutzerimonas stutzeri TaxID=316 RepID=UPI002657C6CA|nr:Rha family transcriptional regulator [Stutzerimonas stutzeri]